MALRYDFDMVVMAPAGLPDKFGDLAITGVATEKVAMFRDPATVAALQNADAAVQAYFADSGFALQVHNSGAPAGHYPMRDEEARVALIDRLSANLKSHDLTKAQWGEFDFDSFMTALATAEPVEDALLAPVHDASDQPDEVIAARIAARRRNGRRLIALGGLMLGLILLFYVASQTLL